MLVDGNHKIREYQDEQEEAIIREIQNLYLLQQHLFWQVTRDEIMKDIINEYPQYEFEKHKGYGTKRHRELILKCGPCNIHRKSFLKKILGESNIV